MHPFLSFASRSAAPAFLLLVLPLAPRTSGVESGSNGAPANCSRALPSCSACHSSSAPFAGRSNGPTTSLTASKRALNRSEAISVTTAVSGGVAGSTGGFVCEATAGSFTAGPLSHILTNSASITHSGIGARSWTYTYTAPTTPGPVELTSCGMSSNGSGSSGDRFAFNGFDNNATAATPLRLYVLPAGVTNRGSGCADAYGNQSVLGATSAPAVGNTAFACQLIGAAPASLAVLWIGFNPPGFPGLDLGALAGLTGCHGYVASPAATLTSLTGAGSAVRGEGTATFALPMPNLATLHGMVVDVQAACVDNSVAGSRSFPLSFSNGLTIAIP